MRARLVWALVIALLLGGGAGATAGAAAPAYAYTFETHAAFFSAETKQPAVVDPQVFVAAAAVPAATGPQNIVHAAGYRPARPGSDPATAPLFSARGRPLNLTLGAWLGAAGRGTTTCAGDTATVRARFTGLIPGGLYQLTRLQFTVRGPQRTPLGQPDGAGSTFTAAPDGIGTFTGRLPFCPDATEGVVLAYHSDGTTHGAALGDIGVNLHNQLAARIAATPGLPNTGAGGAAGGVAPRPAIPFGLAVAGLLLLALVARRPPRRRRA
ncbi:MAG TPA: hypothetical protein VFL91_18600 [Thermomicrobiales bacterium]|nr:hypothetical protein [Thermomicrobiales bacterium]